PRAIEGQIAADDDLHGAIDDVRAIEATSQDNAQARIRRVISLWTRVNTQRTGATPPLTALLVGTTTVAHLQTALDNHPILMQTVENEKAELNQKRAALRNAASKVDQNNKRWFAAWEGNFADGTPERDATTRQLLWQVEGVDADFTHPIALTDTSPKHVTSGAAADVTVRFKTLVSNSVGTTESAVVEAVAAA
ncbi:MAG: hypothetical protein EB034_20910, partial [Verrucomicrobia bacterium]|nr:hypothetical protein [Verrucomicrobiota bacterium]